MIHAHARKPYDARNLRRGAPRVPRQGDGAQEAETGRARRARLDPFRGRLTMQYQVQEMLRLERIFEPELIQAGARRLQSARARRSELEGDVDVRISRRRGAQGRARPARRGRDGDVCSGWRLCRAWRRSPTRISTGRPRSKTSAVHFLRFELTPEMVEGAQGRRADPGRDRPSALQGGGRRFRRHAKIAGRGSEVSAALSRAL